MGLETDRSEGLAAANLKNDPAWQRAIRLALEKTVRSWVESTTTEAREAQWHRWHAINEIAVNQLDVVENRGHIAQAALKQHAKSA